MRNSATLLAAFLAFTAANLIHNDFGFDPAIIPAALLVGIYWWRPRRVLLWAAAVVIALPALVFIKWGALGNPADIRFFLNHVALLLAGTLAVLSVLVSVVFRQRTVSNS
jgi:hypothetical protein